MAAVDQEQIDFIVKSLKNIEYGSIVITIHEGQLVQVERTEKNRFAPQKKATARKTFQN